VTLNVRKLEAGEFEGQAQPEPAPALDPQALLQAFAALVATASPQQPPKPPEPLEPLQDEQARVLAHWAAEPKVLTMIPLESDFEKNVARTHGGKYPAQFRVNGVEFNTWKGITIEVPQSIADLIAYTQNPWAYRDGDKPNDMFDEDAVYQMKVLGPRAR